MESSESREKNSYCVGTSSGESSSESVEDLDCDAVSSSSRVLELEKQINELYEMLRLQRELDKIDNMRQKVLQKMQQHGR